MTSASTSTAGPNRAAADAALAQMTIDTTLAPLAALVVTLAETLDNGAGSQTANVAREYRVAVDRLLALAPKPDDPLDAFLATLSTPVYTNDRTAD
jgi:hypothetical protein